MKLDPASIDLRIVPTSRLRLHEDFDPWRAKRLIVNLRHQAVLKNPLIVTESDDIFIVLDGATRATALASMGVPHVLVQVVRYDDSTVRLQNWNHILIGLPSSTLLQDLKHIPHMNCLVSDLPEMQAGLRARRVLVGVVTGDNSVLSYTSSEASPGRIRQLAEVVASYRGRAEVHRTSDIDMLTLFALHPDLTAVVVFPPFTPDDINHCAANEAKLPMGITRHLISGRALGVNVPLELLGSDRPLDEKNAWLHEHLQNRLRRHMVRLYEEPTFVFDE